MNDAEKAIREQGGTAFPTCVSADSEGGLNHGTTGMSLRDYFAGQAMIQQVHLVGLGSRDEWSFMDLATTSYLIADAMLKARAETT